VKRPKAIASHRRVVEHVQTGVFVVKVKRLSTAWPLSSVVNCSQASGLKYNK